MRHHTRFPRTLHESGWSRQGEWRQVEEPPHWGVVLLAAALGAGALWVFLVLVLG